MNIFPDDIFLRRALQRAHLQAGRAAVAGGARQGDGLGDAGPVGHEGDAAGVWHRDQQRAGAARIWARRVHELVRHAYDSGIRFFETAESYAGMHEMLGIALKGIPRENYRLMTKVTTGDGKDPQTKIDELRRAAQTDYFDIMLLHVQKTADMAGAKRRAGRM